jgi:hypothetical protein
VPSMRADCGHHRAVVIWTVGHLSRMFCLTQINTDMPLDADGFQQTGDDEKIFDDPCLKNIWQPFR